MTQPRDRDCIISIQAMVLSAALVFAGYYILSHISENSETIKALEADRQKHICKTIGGTPVETGRGYMRRCDIGGYVIGEVTASRIYNEMARRKALGY